MYVVFTCKQIPGLYCLFLASSAGHCVNKFHANYLHVIEGGGGGDNTRQYRAAHHRLDKKCTIDHSRMTRCSLMVFHTVAWINKDYLYKKKQQQLIKHKSFIMKHSHISFNNCHRLTQIGLRQPRLSDNFRT